MWIGFDSTEIFNWTHGYNVFYYMATSCSIHSHKLPTNSRMLSLIVKSVTAKVTYIPVLHNSKKRERKNQTFLRSNTQYQISLDHSHTHIHRHSSRITSTIPRRRMYQFLPRLARYYYYIYPTFGSEARPMERDARLQGIKDLLLADSAPEKRKRARTARPSLWLGI